MPLLLQLSLHYGFIVFRQLRHAQQLLVIIEAGTEGVASRANMPRCPGSFFPPRSAPQSWSGPWADPLPDPAGHLNLSLNWALSPQYPLSDYQEIRWHRR